MKSEIARLACRNICGNSVYFSSLLLLLRGICDEQSGTGIDSSPGSPVSVSC